MTKGFGYDMQVHNWFGWEMDISKGTWGDTKPRPKRVKCFIDVKITTLKGGKVTVQAARAKTMKQNVKQGNLIMFQNRAFKPTDQGAQRKQKKC